jgi:uncharacterized YigZ family protein
MTPDFYTTIESSAKAEYKDRGSKFIGYAFPLSNTGDFREKLAAIKKEHPKASHYCFAYRMGLEGATHRISDDGEPSGTAGRPILGQIDSKELTDVLVIVVRYFGGTLLGVTGLINAYKTSASLVLQTTLVIQKPVLMNCRIEFDYSRMSDVMKMVKKFDGRIIGKEMQLFNTFEVSIPKINWEEAYKKLNGVKGIKITVF